MKLYGQIDLAALGNVVRNHPELVKTFTTKDGVIHKVINVNVEARKSPDQYGRSHYIKVAVKKEQQKQGVNYFVADLKESQQNAQAPQAAPQNPPQQNEDDGDLPF